jgi:hypothetical protein
MSCKRVATAIRELARGLLFLYVLCLQVLQRGGYYLLKNLHLVNNILLPSVTGYK